MTEAKYQIVLLGQIGGNSNRLIDRVKSAVSDLGLDRDSFIFLNAAEVQGRDRSLPIVSAYFGGDPTRDNAEVLALIEDSVLIVPVVDRLTNVGLQLPTELLNVNAISLEDGATAIERISSLLLEVFRLLRKERKLFISYKRSDAQPLADRLYDEFDRRGFDVFLDVRSVPLAVDVQNELWHRMSDSDVVVLIDSPNFRTSPWTTEELARANATNIQILHLLWPGQTEDSSSAFSHFYPLLLDDFKRATPGRGKGIKSRTVDRIVRTAEQLRARAMAARYRYLVDSFCDLARDYSLSPTVQSERWISIESPNSGLLAVVPAVGIPTSDRIEQFFQSMNKLPRTPEAIWLIFDSRGILDSWLGHLKWLDEHLPVKAVQMSSAEEMLKEMAK